MTEQDEINASFQRMVELDTKDTCFACESLIEQGISFCNAICENTLVANPTIFIKGLTPYKEKNGKTLFDDLDENNIKRFTEKNQNQKALDDVILSITNFESPLSAEETDCKFKEFIETKKGMVLDVASQGMFYKCYYSEGFECVTIHVKFYYRENNPIVEFRQLRGCAHIFHNIYTSFKNYICNENNSTVREMNPILEAMNKMAETYLYMTNTMEWLNRNPYNGINASLMSQARRNKIIMWGELYSAVHDQHEILISDCNITDKIYFFNEIQKKIANCIDESNIHP